MIISHFPAGYINTYFSKKVWFKKLSKKQYIMLLVLGSLLGLLPDIDFLYIYLFSAELSHRELITHSPILYLVGAILLYIIGLTTRNNFIKSFSFLFFLSPSVHLLLDATTAGIPLMYPFSHKLYGLLMISALNNGIYGSYIYVFLYGVELLIILFFINLLFFQFINKKLIRSTGIILSVLLFSVFVIFMTCLNVNLYPKNSLHYYGDIDNDNIINMRDNNMDGDFVLNIEDEDADNDGLGNREDVLAELNKMDGIWYDISEDRYFNIISRFGLLSSSDLVLKSYDAAGIFLGNEMKFDREKKEELYQNDPKDEYFYLNYNNIYTFFHNNNYIVDNKSDLKAGDLIFLGEGENITSILIIVKIVDNQIFVLRGNGQTNKIEITELDKITNLDNFINYGKILK